MVHWMVQYRSFIPSPAHSVCEMDRTTVVWDVRQRNIGGKIGFIELGMNEQTLRDFAWLLLWPLLRFRSGRWGRNRQRTSLGLARVHDTIKSKYTTSRNLKGGN